MKQILPLLLALSPLCTWAEDTPPNDYTNQLDYETEGYTLTAKNSDNKFLQKMQPSIKFGGYIMGK